jgi:hypothetical protein
MNDSEKGTAMAADPFFSIGLKIKRFAQFAESN